MTRLYQKYVVFVAFLFLIFTGIFSLVEANQNSSFMTQGNDALDKGKYETAEEFFEKALIMRPENFLATRELAKVKIKLNKLNEALSLLNNILKLPISTGRNILIYMNDNVEPIHAELIDETVMAIDTSTNKENDEFSKFLKDDLVEPIPHYRVYLKKTGKIKLLPKNKNRIKYFGIPSATREQITVLKNKVKKKIIASIKVTPKEEMVRVDAGCFLMGSNKGDLDEVPVHKVCISTFKLGKYEVMQKNFQAVMGANPSENVGPNHPVDSVSWIDARDYCKKLGLRLPSEAEWEYSARAGTKTDFYWGSKVTGKEANFCDKTCELNIGDPFLSDKFRHTAPVGSFPPNSFGLFDMSGNVSEWVQDWLDVEKNYYMVSPETDPLGPRAELDTCQGVCAGAASMTHKIYRGGSWNQMASEMRSANRRESHFQLQAAGNGFRCALN